MNKLVELVEKQEFSAREIVLLCISLLFGGILLGIICSPKGDRRVGCNNGNNNSGCLSPENIENACQEDEE